MEDFLYRGVNEEIFKNKKGLAPKGTSFVRAIQYGTGFKYGTITYGASERNAVVSHQKDSSRFPTLGVSTTPIFDRAKYYALSCGSGKKGYIYKISRSMLRQFNVKEYKVAEYLSNPDIPEDNEVILVSKNGDLSAEVVIEIIEVSNDHKLIKHPQVDLF
jgi:hypothetical protein